MRLNLLLRREMLSSNLPPAIDNRYFKGYFLKGHIYISGIKYENWLEDYGTNTIIIPSVLEYEGEEYPVILDSKPSYNPEE